MSVEQLSAEAVSNPGNLGNQGNNNSGKKPMLLSNPLFIASDEGVSNQFADDDEHARSSDDDDFEGNQAKMQAVVDQMTDED